ncbi:protein YABBY 7-like isoform X1 [Musa acuminata AAA Group]|uniref:protein YABBY 7-like isoform X1 n=1 Tax=Musa acuminata AAA Group TaxID=214697 RepID=UPI0031D04A62
MMSSSNPLLELPEQLGYVQCSFCATILLVSVPCSSLLKVVTVRCGHCTGLLSVSLVRTSVVPVELLASLGDEEGKQEDLGPKACSSGGGGVGEAENETRSPTRAPIINKRKQEHPILLTSPHTQFSTFVLFFLAAPEKRQRAPSAYNHFIREEIVRIKAREPNITHKEAFSAAAKNWAHFPRIQHNEDGKSCSSREGKKICDGHVDEEMHGRRNNLHQRKTPKQAACSGEET